MVFCKSMSFMDPCDVVEKYQNDDAFRKHFDEGVQNAADMSKRSFPPDSLNVQKGSRGKVTHKCTALNALEFLAQFGVPARQKAVRYMPSMEIPSHKLHGELERVWLFDYDHTSKYRTVSLSRYIDVGKTTHMQTPEAHVFRGQTNLLMEFSLDAELGEAGYTALGHTAIKSLAEYKSNLKSFDDDDVAAEAPVGTQLTLGNTSLLPSGHDSDQAGQSSTMVPMFTGTLVTSGANAPCEPPKISPAKKQHRRQGSATVEDAFGSADQVDDAASMFSGLTGITTGDGPNRLNTTARHIAKLRCEDALLFGNQGVARYHASEYLNKVGAVSNEGRELKKHIAIFDAHDALTEGKMMRLTGAELQDRLRVVTETRDGKPLPSAIQLGLVRHAANNKRVCMSSEDSMSWYSLCKPWTRSTEQFDPCNPQASQSVCTFADKLALFIEFFVKKSLSPLLCEGALCKDALISVVDFVLKDVSLSLDDESMDSLMVSTLMSLALGFRAVQACIHLANNDFESVTESFFEELDEFKTSDDPVVSAIRGAFADSTVFEEVVRKATVHNAVLKECIPHLAEIHALLASLELGNFTLSLSTLAVVVEKLPRAQRSFDCMSSSPLKCERDLVAKMQTITKGILADLKSTDSASSLRKLSELLACASNEIPFDADIPIMQQEVAEILEQTNSKTRYVTFKENVTRVTLESCSADAWDAFVQSWRALNGIPIPKLDAACVDAMLVLVVQAFTRRELAADALLNTIKEVRIALGTAAPDVDAVLGPLDVMDSLDVALGKCTQKFVCTSGSTLTTVLIESCTDEVSALLKAYAEAETHVKQLEQLSKGEDVPDLILTCIHALRGQITSAGGLIAVVARFEMDGAMVDVSKSHAAIKDTALGLPERNEWMEGCSQAADWQTLDIHASKTLMTNVAIPKMKPHLQQLGKALCFVISLILALAALKNNSYVSQHILLAQTVCVLFLGRFVLVRPRWASRAPPPTTTRHAFCVGIHHRTTISWYKASVSWYRFGLGACTEPPMRVR